MVDAQIQTALLDALGRMPLPSQQVLLDVALRLAVAAEPTPGTPFHQLKHLVGTLPNDVVDEMQQAIDDHCERIDSDAW